MSGAIDGFDWDDGNREHCAKHGVTAAAVEALFGGVIDVFPDLRHSTDSETRSIAVGRTARGRHMLVVFTVRKKGALRLIRPISARYMHAKEVKHYEETAKTRQ